MHREVSILQTLGHEGIPQVIESNTDKYDEDVDLYFVSTFIPGPTLAIKVKSGPCELEMALRAVIRIVTIVEHCHQEGAIHRDIKPDNIVLKNGDIESPVLLDFGLSYNEEFAKGETLTETQQELGDRFLWLPELRVEESYKRDLRSDVTACCGLLFFMLTSMRPVSLSDEQGRKPHQRPSARLILDEIEIVEKRALLRGIFDTGFEMQIDRRWQSAEALRLQLEKVIDISAKGPEGPQDIQSTIRRMRDQLTSSGTYASRREVHDLLTEIDAYVQFVQKQVADQLGPDFRAIQANRTLNMNFFMITNDLGFVCKGYDATPFLPTFKAYVTGDEVVLTGHHADQATELLRTPMAAFSINNEFRSTVMDYFVRGAARFFDGIGSGG